MFDDLSNNLSPELATFVLAMLPVTELRGAIPLAIFRLGLPPMEAFLWSVLGNSLAGALVAAFLDPVSRVLRQFYIFDRFFMWLFERTRRRHSKNFEKYQSLALLLFVAIPLPMTGAWSGAAAAFVFGIKKRSAIPIIALGVFMAGVIVTLVSTGAIQLGGFLASLFAPSSR
ncbi:MAG: small multi-drug export protein [Chloroflexi bacterium]|nr:small multi-drug export protein [Chloroflexota bacterium]